MIKIEIPLGNKSEFELRKELVEWCTINIGPQKPRGKHNQKQKKKWDIKGNYYTFGNQIITLFVRSPAEATFVSLMWK